MEINPIGFEPLQDLEDLYPIHEIICKPVFLHPHIEVISHEINC